MTSFLGSLFALFFLKLQIPGDQLFYIRLEQVYGFCSLILVYCAVILTPLSKLKRNCAFMDRLLFARRGVGVSAAYFALLHVYISFFFQSGGFSGLAILPGRFVFAFIVGIISLVVLLLMAVTSFDKAIDYMGFKNWKRLHRFVYLAGILIVVHVWLIGTHTEYTWLKIAGFIALIVLFLLETLRIELGLRKKENMSRSERYTVAFGFFFVMTSSVLFLPVVTQNYHSSHHGSHSEHGAQQ